MLDEYKFCIKGPDGSYDVTVTVPPWLVVEPVWNGLKFTTTPRMADFSFAEVKYLLNPC